MEEALLNTLLFPYLIELLEKDSNIIDRKLHENCINHRLAMYMGLGIEHNVINVDCEYNKNMDGAKEVLGHKRLPDIIIHQRKSNENNLILIEAKKQKLDVEDIEKINYYLLEPYKYKVTVGVLYKPKKSYMNICALSTRRLLNYQINKQTFVIEKTFDEVMGEHEIINQLFRQ